MNVAMESAAVLHLRRLQEEALGQVVVPEAPPQVDPVPDAGVVGWLRLEGLVMLALGVAAFAALGASWWLFAALALVPDVALLGYLRGPRVGAAVYNAAHSTVAPALVAAAGLAAAPALLPVAAVWLAHIGLDRALGYGLKLRTGFGATHLGRIGR